MNQLDLHKKIDGFFSSDPAKTDPADARALLINDDAQAYFFSWANANWINWLQSNHFFRRLSDSAKDPSNYSYRLPELEYLTRMVETAPISVASIIDSTKISESNFNPEVIDRFIWIINLLPAEQIKTLLGKVKNERWVYLMRNFHKSGYEFEKIVRKLNDSKESRALLELAGILFEISGNIENTDKLFYVSDLEASGIFEAVSEIQSSEIEAALRIMTTTIGKLMRATERDTSEVFEYSDLFSLYDIDFSTLKIRDRRNYSHGEDARNLLATIKALVDRKIDCNDTVNAKKIFSIINDLPSSRLTWRFKLYVLSLCPTIFTDELKDCVFKLFKNPNYHEIVSGTEYKKALKKVFPIFSKEDQREYVSNVITYFSSKTGTDTEQKWRNVAGWKILSTICTHLNLDEKQECEKLFGKKCDETYEPEPLINQVRSGFVAPKSPVNLNDFSIIEIVKNLKTEWAPKKLNEQFKNDDFLNPRGSEGLGEALKEDFKKRSSEYISNITNFFSRGEIHPLYLYSVLRSMEEMLREKNAFDLTEIKPLINLFDLIRTEGERLPFKREEKKTWLIDWVEVHKVIIDILLFLLETKSYQVEIFTNHRTQIRDLITYLFTIKDSPTEDKENTEADLYTIAINTVRGRAYEAFVVFTERDGKILADDTKDLYKKTLKDRSSAVRFVIGRYLASFYFRDEKFITELLSEIFPKDVDNEKKVYLATWEGYLSNTLYSELFDALEKYYSHAISLQPSGGEVRNKHSKNIDEALAIHIALAFLHLDLDFNSPLLTKFWHTVNTKRHHEFISFIGRSTLTRDQVSDEWLIENKVSKEKLIGFWNWALEHISEPEILKGFGFWINPNKEILDERIISKNLATTLEKTSGQIDWDYGFLRRLPIFAEKDGPATIKIISNYFLDKNQDINKNHVASAIHQNEIRNALEIIYRNGNSDSKKKVTSLVNLLIEKGSTPFWGFKTVLND